MTKPDKFDIAWKKLLNEALSDEPDDDDIIDVKPTPKSKTLSVAEMTAALRARREAEKNAGASAQPKTVDPVAVAKHVDAKPAPTLKQTAPAAPVTVASVEAKAEDAKEQLSDLNTVSARITSSISD